MTRPPADPAEPAEPAEPADPVPAVTRLFLVQLLAVIAIAGVITTVVTVAGWGGDPGLRTTAPKGAAGGSPAASSTPSPAPPTNPSPAPPTGTTTATDSTAPRDVRPRVDVLNQSAANGAAEETAEGLRAAGWRIGRVDDFTGTVRETTVYFPRRLRADARVLARDLPGSPRLLERLSTLSPRRLSVVLVD